MKITCLALPLLFALAPHAFAGSSTCALPQPQLRVHRADIFSNQQEQWLGDAQADMIEPRLLLLPASESTYLDRIGQRLLRQLPPTSIHYTFRIFESPDLRAFSLAGGHVYISRKLVMDAQSEDELAAMLAQEIGRIYIHHTASAVTRLMESTMHIHHLTDRADVENRFELVLNMPADPYAYLSYNELRSDEALADRVGLYAMIRAHYNPRSFPAFLDRIYDNNGNTGNLFTDVFDATPLVSYRVRMAKKLVASMPTGCFGDFTRDDPRFRSFQQTLGQQRIDPIVAPTPGLNSLALQPLEPALTNIRISADGKSVLAQDAYQIHVLSTDPPALRFSIDAFGAEKAQFTPDSQSLVLHYNDMHVEKWKLSTGQPTSIQDYVDYAGCLQTSLSPDGTAMACVSPYYGLLGNSVWLKLADIAQNKMLYQNHSFFDAYTPTFQAQMRWSRDGRYFVATSGMAAMAYDLHARSTVRLEGELASLMEQRFVFVGSDNMLSTCDINWSTGSADQLFQMCFTTFPTGQTLKKIQLPFGSLKTMTDNHHVLFGPLNKAAVGVLDPSTGTLGDQFPEESVDLLGNTLAAEIPEGGVAIGQLHGTLQKVALPPTPLTTVKASTFSADGQFLAVSNRARGAVWNLQTGRRTAVTEPFLAAQFDHFNLLQANTIPAEITRHSVQYLDPLRSGSVDIHLLPINAWKTFNNEVRLEARDATTQKQLWSRIFWLGAPWVVPAEGDRSLLITGYHNWTGHGKLIYTSDQTLAAHLAPIGSVIEIVSNQTGQNEHVLFTPQIPPANCFCSVHAADLFGSLLAVRNIHNETTIYETDHGKRLFAFFGQALAADASLGMVAATDRLQELNLYDTRNGQRLAHYLLDQDVLAARFLPALKQVLVLTASQRVYRIDLSAISTAAPTQISANTSGAITEHTSQK